MVKYLVSIILLFTALVSYAQLNCSDSRYTNVTIKAQCMSLNTGNNSVEKIKNDYIQSFYDTQIKYLATLNSGLPSTNNNTVTNNLISTSKPETNISASNNSADTSTDQISKATQKTNPAPKTKGPNWTY